MFIYDGLPAFKAARALMKEKYPDGARAIERLLCFLSQDTAFRTHPDFKRLRAGAEQQLESTVQQLLIVGRLK